MARRCTRIIGHMVTRNEMGRYLPGAVRWLQQITDVVCILDDNSDDGTYEWLQGEKVCVSRRPLLAKSFAEDESAFRAAAWTYLEDSLNPTGTDWVLCIDADEFLVSPESDDTREQLIQLVEDAAGAHRCAVTFPVREVFGFEGSTPLVRTDGFWGEIEAVRLVRWQYGAGFASRRQGGGSIPAGWGAKPYDVEEPAIMHLGYARPEDRQAKHARYSGTVGHNPSHVASILQPPSLVPWYTAKGWRP